MSAGADANGAQQDAPLSKELATQLDSAPLPEANAPVAPLDGEILDYLSDTATEWSLEPGETLQLGLSRWCGEAGWSLVWLAGNDYPIQAGLQFPAGTTFRDAVRETLKAVWRQNPTLKATVYKNRVLVITDAGSEGK